MRRAFTLIELLISLAVIGLLLSLLLPGVHAAREAARNAECRSNLHQLGIDLERLNICGKLPRLVLGYRPTCPTLVAQYEDWQSYEQLVADMTHPQILAYYDAPSDRIVVVQETMPVHHDSVNLLYLDGHVD
jgi:prepilin-type N-terminal cleavage/methylation domain-containing protein/prepilin-type processing-associated H-X9-DG protein